MVFQGRICAIMLNSSQISLLETVVNIRGLISHKIRLNTRLIKVFRWIAAFFRYLFAAKSTTLVGS
jgi:hypothetical protein